MTQKSLIIPELKRCIKPPFAWIDRGFMFNGFFAESTPDELLLYFFLILVADRDGLSYYSYDKICQLLHMDVDTYVKARNTLIDKKLIAFDNAVFQVLALPQHKRQCQATTVSTQTKQTDYQAMTQLFKQLGNHQG